MERADIRVGDARDGASLLAETLDADSVHDLAGQELDGNGPIESRITSTIDFPHPSGAKRCQDLKRAEAGSRYEPHDGVDWEYSDSMVLGSRRCRHGFRLGRHAVSHF